MSEDARGESGAAMYDGVDAARLAAQKDFTLRVAALIDSFVDFDEKDRLYGISE